MYVGNLPFNATEEDVKVLFERHGKVDSVKLINDRETGKPRGFGFVDMAPQEAQAAIQALNGFRWPTAARQRSPGKAAAPALRRRPLPPVRRRHAPSRLAPPSRGVFFIVGSCPA